jgi:hypothetical protein
MFRKIFSSKVFGSKPKHTKNEEKIIREKYGLRYGDAQKINEMVKSKHMDHAMALLEKECKLKGFALLPFEEKQNMVKEISRMRI